MSAALPLPATSPAPDWRDQFASRASGMVASEIRELLKVLSRPGIVSFAGGIPDPALFPKEAFARASAAIFADAQRSAAALQYSVSEGHPGLRSWIAEHMAGLGIPCGPENILVTSGSQQALDFIGKLMLSPGDTILATTPTYLGALQAFSAYEPSYQRIEPEHGNETPEHLINCAASSGGRPKLLYIVPDFANPTGITLDAEARSRLIDLADATGALVVEDAAYSQLRYEGQPIAPLTAMAIERAGGIEQARSVYCGTFSKTLAPGLRVGWVAGPRAIIEKLVLIKQAGDLHSGTLDQAVMCDVATASFADQLPILRTTYRKRRDAMIGALEAFAPNGVHWAKPAGGLFVWVTLPDKVDTRILLPRALDEAQVAYVPGPAFFFDGRGHNTMRLSFSLADEAMITRGIERLMQLVSLVLLKPA